MTRTTDWASRLLADTSEAMLLVWADHLEEVDDPACEGVREFLVGEGWRPENDSSHTEYSWWDRKYKDGFPNLVGISPDDIDNEVFTALQEFDLKDGVYVSYRFDPHDPASRALAHYTALHDAATAYASMSEEWKKARREKRNKENASA